MDVNDLESEELEQYNSQISFKKKKNKTIIIVMLSTLAGMTIYETLKQIISPDITIWESHTVTIIFSTIIATIATYYVLKKFEIYTQEIIFKENQRRLANIQLKKSEKKFRDAYFRAEFYKDLFTHDLNNIFQHVKSALDLISIKHNNPKSQIDILEILDMANNQVVRATNLISNVQKLTQIDEANGILKPIEVIQTLNNAINYINKSYVIKDLDIKISSNINDSYVLANEFLVDIFENIIINAINYNENSKIEIFIQISKQIKNKIAYLKIEFKDNGIGISDEMKSILFKIPIKKKRNVKGMGLGLLLVKRILNLYNGQIYLEDKIKGDHRKGTNFIILIPEARKFEINLRS